MISRRSLIISLVAMPAVIRVATLMPIKVQPQDLEDYDEIARQRAIYRMRWLPCDGRTLARADYPDLSEVFPLTDPGVPEGYFRIPNLRWEGFKEVYDGVVKDHVVRSHIKVHNDDTMAAGQIIPLTEAPRMDLYQRLADRPTIVPMYANPAWIRAYG